jgi:hypothetical protein
MHPYFSPLPVRIALLAAALLLYLCQNHSFFGDIVQLSSKQAHFFYDHGYGQIILPLENDTGHPPLMGLYLSACWQVFGRSLAVSHWAVLPFVVLLVVQAWRWCQFFWRDTAAIWGFALLLSIPVLVAQAALVSPDILLISFFVTSANAILYRQTRWLWLVLILLSLVSMRGLMASVGLALFQVVYNWAQYKQSLRALVGGLLSFLPAWVLALAFFAYHYAATGWLGYHASSPWAPCFEPATWLGILKNGLILAWRVADFGMFAVWLAAFYALLRPRNGAPSKQATFFSLLLCLALTLLPTLFVYQNLSAHRYLLPLYWVGISWAWGCVVAIWQTRTRYLASAGLLCCASFWSGHLWIYPPDIAQGWHASLAYIPFLELRRQALHDIKQRGLDRETVGSTAFVGLANRYTDLSDPADTLALLNRDFDQHEYILYSNVSNSLNDAEWTRLNREYTPINTLYRRGVYIVLYERRRSE